MPGTDETCADRPVAPATDHAETALLHDLVRWREALARSIARNNLTFRSGQIATAVNRFLLPLVFLASAEDRHLLPAGTLTLLRNCADLQTLHAVLCPFADELYADILPDTSQSPHPAGSPVLEAQVVRSILEDLAAPEKRGDFRQISPVSLGQVLTHYLARTVRRSAVHHAGIVDEHDTVLSGGTVIPPLIVIRSLAEHALDTARMNRSSKEILPLRVLDPACGPGTVLVAAYRDLIRTAVEPDLTFEERREVLARAIHGVDLNPHAVAAARMLLVLELLEDHPPCRDPAALLKRVQPVFSDLRYTILCGNALVGPDIREDESWNFCPVRARHSLNPFDWNDHFTEVRAAGGFDVILSNPPEGAIETHEWIQQYFQRHYSSYHRAADRSVYFVEKALTLLRAGGTLAFVMGSRWLRIGGGSPLRRLLKSRRIEEIAEYPGSSLCSILVRNAKPSGPFMVVRSEITGLQDGTGRIVQMEHFPVDPADLDEGGWVFCDTRTDAILAKMEERGTPVAHFCMGESGCGSLERADERLFISRGQRDRLVRRDRRSNDLLRPFVVGRGIGRYYAKSSRNFFLLLPSQTDREEDEKALLQRIQNHYPAVARYLKTPDTAAAINADNKSPWYVTRCKIAFMSKNITKIFFPCQSIVPVFTYDDGRSVIDRNTGYLVTSSRYLLAVLNSRLARFWFMHRQLAADARGLTDTVAAVAGFFIHVPDLDDEKEANRHARIGMLAQKMLVYHEQLAGGRDEIVREPLRKKIERADRQIDALVYELYGLTPEEIAVVEESTGK